MSTGTRWPRAGHRGADVKDTNRTTTVISDSTAAKTPMLSDPHFPPHHGSQLDVVVGHDAAGLSAAQAVAVYPNLNLGHSAGPGF